MILTMVPTAPNLTMTMYEVTSAPSDYDYEVTSASDRGEPEAGLLVRWFNIFQHFISVEEMDKEEIWSFVKTDRLWKEKADCVFDDYSWPPLGKGFLKHGSLETLLDDIDEGGVIDSEAWLQPGDLTDNRDHEIAMI